MAVSKVCPSVKDVLEMEHVVLGHSVWASIVTVGAHKQEGQRRRNDDGSRGESDKMLN